MGYLIDPTEIIFNAISNNAEALKRLQEWWEFPYTDIHGYNHPQTKAERIQGLVDWFYIETENIAFHSPLMATIFDTLTDPDTIDWDQLEYKLYEGPEDEE